MEVNTLVQNFFSTFVIEGQVSVKQRTRHLAGFMSSDFRKPGSLGGLELGGSWLRHSFYIRLNINSMHMTILVR